MTRRIWLAAAAALIVSNAYAAQTVRLSKEKFVDKCKGAWAGQMIGVCYGGPYEFKSNGKPILDELKAWKPNRVAGAIQQDDCYVEMTFLMAIERHGIDITGEQAGKAFGDSQYKLWHANRFGRDNIRRGIMPPKSGHPDYNVHADDIDFQIEADLFGIICPMLPRESNRLCDVFGHIMNYGDGVYGGMFVAGMYAAAYGEDRDVHKVIQAGLACIPAESQYHKCISDVIRWHKEYPDEWLAAWKKIEEKWQDDLDCHPGSPFNIDAKLNGAYIVMGLVYGEGDFLKTMEISTRCGQDADCNPSNAAGVLGCMKGYSGLASEFTAGIPKIAEEKFSHTNYSFSTLIPACQKVAESLIKRAGGSVEADAYVIPSQKPEAAPLEQWSDADQKQALSQPISQRELDRWDSGWTLIACGMDMDPGVRDEEFGRQNVLALHPADRQKPGAIEKTFEIPSDALVLVIVAASHPDSDCGIRVTADEKVLHESTLATNGTWKTLEAPVEAYRGKKVKIRLENLPANAWRFDALYLGSVAIR